LPRSSSTWYAGREPPAAWPLEPWEPERRAVPVAVFPRGPRCGDFLPGCYRELMEELTGDGNVDNYRVAPGAARAAVGGAAMGLAGEGLADRPLLAV
jgi:hypothetical protein